MSQTWRIRAATPDDAGALCTTCWPQRSYATVYEHLYRVWRMAERQRASAAVVLNATDDQPIGYGQLVCWQGTGEIADLIIAPAWREQGIGSALIRYLIGRANVFHLAYVEIGAALSNPRALALYQRLGFQVAYQRSLMLEGQLEAICYLRLPLA